MKVLRLLVVVMLVAAAAPAFAADPVSVVDKSVQTRPDNQSPLLPQPDGAVRFYSQFELYNGLRYRILQVRADGNVEAVLDPSRIDSLEWAGGAASGGDAGAGPSAGPGGGDTGGNGESGTR